MKTKDAFALRDFDFGKFIREKLSRCGLSSTALEVLDVNRGNFHDLQRAKQSYRKFDDELKVFRAKIIRHCDRLLKYQMSLMKDVARLDDDEYYLSILKPRNKRTVALSEEYGSIAQKLIESEDIVGDIISIVDQYQRFYCTKIFAERLREARQAAGLTQTELATKIGVKRSSFNAFETARNEPNISVLVMVSQELKRPVDWLLGL